MNVWDAYHLGVRLRPGWPRMPGGRVPVLLSLARRLVNVANWLTPIDFVRYREFDFALKAIERHKPSPQLVVDIGSPKLLPLTVAQAIPKARVYATDIRHTEAQAVRVASERLHIAGLTPQVQDARALGLASGRFDLVTSISVIEHIAPEHGGEVPAMQELARVMSERGVAIITVPFSKSRFVEYRVGQVYERASAGVEPVFFQRFYDHDLLMKNLVQASGLEVVYLGFIEERFFFRDPRRRLALYINSSRKQNLVFGPLFPLLSRVFLSSPRPLEECKKPYIACLVLTKS